MLQTLTYAPGDLKHIGPTHRETGLCSPLKPDGHGLLSAFASLSGPLYSRYKTMLYRAEGRGSKVLSEALAATERKVELYREELDGLRRTNAQVFKAPSDWPSNGLRKERKTCGSCFPVTPNGQRCF